jgi:hypothetical protein
MKALDNNVTGISAAILRDDLNRACDLLAAGLSDHGAPEPGGLRAQPGPVRSTGGTAAEAYATSSPR